MARKYLEILGTPDVLAAQERSYGRARPIVAAVEVDPLGPAERDFIAARDSFYVASMSQSGWPYLQHRGGPAGFLRVLGPTTVAFADYTGNHQLITTGNVAGSDRVSLFLMDYPHRRRLKILGHARIEDAHGCTDLVGLVAESAGKALVERIVVIEIVSFDWNCPKYITPRFTEAQVGEIIAPLQREIAELRAQLNHARAALSEQETKHV
jgi:uncharacterized protein